MTGRGRFIVLEGLDGVGKSTHGRALAEHLGAEWTREPGGTAVGERIRALVLDPTVGALDRRAEALLMAADRAQHVAERVAPALAAGRHVVADRYLYSSVAYQGHGRGLDPVEIRELSHWATGGLEPDLVVLLESAARTGEGGDRLESEDEAFRARVRQGYRDQAVADPDRWVVLDADGPVERTADAIRAAVSRRLGIG